MKNKLPIGILGATGMVGQRYIQLLENHPVVRDHLACGQRPLQRKDLRRGRQVAAGYAAAGAHCEDDGVAG